MPIGSRNRIDDLHPESVALAEGAENVDVARPLPAEAVIVPDEQLTQPEPAAQNQLDEIFG